MNMSGSFRLHDDTQPETKQQTDFAWEGITHLLPLLELGSAHRGVEQAPQEMGLNETERRCQGHFFYLMIHGLKQSSKLISLGSESLTCFLFWSWAQHIGAWSKHLRRWACTRENEYVRVISLA